MSAPVDSSTSIQTRRVSSSSTGGGGGVELGATSDPLTTIKAVQQGGIELGATSDPVTTIKTLQQENKQLKNEDGTGGGVELGATSDPVTTITILQQENKQLKNENNDLKCEVQQLKDALQKEKQSHLSRRIAACAHEWQVRQLKEDMEKQERSSLSYRIAAHKIKWKDLPDKWKNDASVACEFFRSDRIPQLTIGQKATDRSYRTALEDYLPKSPKLRELPYHLQMNKDVVLGSLQVPDRFGWWGVHISMQEDIDLIRTSILYGRQVLQGDPDTSWYPSGSHIPRHIWETDEVLCLYAIADGLMQVDDCKCVTAETWKKHVEKGDFDWSQLPGLLKHSSHFARSIDWKSIAVNEIDFNWREYSAALRNSEDSATWNGWKELVKVWTSSNGWFQWDNLPLQLRNSVNFAKSINPLNDLPDPTVDLCPILLFSRRVHHLFEKFPSLGHDKNYWLMLNSCYSSLRPGTPTEGVEIDDGSSFEVDNQKKFGVWLRDYARLDLLWNTEDECATELMFTLANDNPWAFGALSKYLKTDHDFVRRLLPKSAMIIAYLGHDFLSDHNYELILKSIPYLTKQRFLDYRFQPVADAIPHHWWERKRFSEAWCSAGLRFRGPQTVMDNWRLNLHLCLLQEQENYGSNYMLRHKFIEDVSFVVDVVRRRPGFLPYGTKAASDPQVMAIAFSASLKVAKIKLTELHFDGHDDTIRELKKYLEDELQIYQTFCECILSNILSSKTYESTQTCLSLLSQGTETSTAYKRRIAEFAGVPIGSRLMELKRAYKNVKHVIEPFDEYSSW